MDRTSACSRSRSALNTLRASGAATSALAQAVATLRAALQG
ncbi:hypothetical protein [Pseudonocardia kujensis]|nr:hypothetical protein [Pseudonocardia kujensis]